MRITINPEVLQWAINRSGVQQLLYDKFPKLDEWLSLESQPTFRQIEKFSKAASVPFGYLVLDTPPDDSLPIPHYRTIKNKDISKTSPNLFETVISIMGRQEWLRDFLIERGGEPLNYVGSANKNQSAQEIARDIRSTLHLQNDWASKERTWLDALKLLHAKMENIGIQIVVNGVVGNNTHRVLDPNEFRGFVLVDEYAPFVFVNGADYKAAQMFTLAHELAHVWLGSSAAFDLRQMQAAENEIERLCDLIAAEFLVPAEDLDDQWEKIKSQEDPFQAIARIYKVSSIVGARRALDLGFITKLQFFEFYDLWKADQVRLKKKRKSGGDFFLNQPYRAGRKFTEAVVIASREGSLLYRDAYNLTGLYGKSFDKFVTETLGY